MNSARTSSAENVQLLIGKADRFRNFDVLGLCVAKKLISDLLDKVKSVSIEGNTGEFGLFVFKSFFLGIFVNSLLHYYYGY